MKGEKMNKMTVVFVIMATVVFIIGVAMIVSSRRSSSEADNTVAFEATGVDEATETTIATEAELSAHAEDDGIELISEPQEQEIIEDASTTQTGVDVPAADSVDAPDKAILDDPYGMYVVTEDWVRNSQFVCVVERNGKLYTINGIVMENVIDDYNIGFEGYTQTQNVTRLFMQDSNRKDLTTSLELPVAVSSGDFPILQISKNEELRMYSTTQRDKILFSSATFYGYTLNATHSGGSRYFPVTDHFILPETSITGNNAAVTYMDGTPVEDNYNLELGREYMFSWYEGTQYYEFPVIANSRCFAVGTNMNYDWHWAPVQLTKNGYSVVDISSFDPGYYYIDEYQGIIEVTD